MATSVNAATADYMAIGNRMLSMAGDSLKTYMLEPVFFDQKTQHWPLLSERAAVLVVGLYLIAIPIAKQLMAGHKPVDCSQFMFFHNLGMMALSIWMLVKSVQAQYFCDEWSKRGFRVWGSRAQDGATFSPACYQLAHVLYIHFLSKGLEFVDTFIMVLKRNDHQISFLHVYHHATTFLCWWITMKIAPGGDTYFVCAINSFVHILMYTYYLVSSYKSIRIPVLVKKSMTSLQLAQFVIVLCQVLYGHFVAEYRPRLILWLALFQLAVFIYLFGSFFRKSYASRKGKIPSRGHSQSRSVHTNGLGPKAT